MQNLVRIAGSSAKIHTKYFQNASLKHYHYINQFNKIKLYRITIHCMLYSDSFNLQPGWCIIFHYQQLL